VKSHALKQNPATIEHRLEQDNFRSPCVFREQDELSLARAREGSGGQAKRNSSSLAPERAVLAKRPAVLCSRAKQVRMWAAPQQPPCSSSYQLKKMIAWTSPMNTTPLGVVKGNPLSQHERATRFPLSARIPTSGLGCRGRRGDSRESSAASDSDQWSRVVQQSSPFEKPLKTDTARIDPRHPNEGKSQK